VAAVVLALTMVMCLLPESLPQSKRHNKVSIVQNFVRVTPITIVRGFPGSVKSAI
jgi:hypothetical protein